MEFYFLEKYCSSASQLNLIYPSEEKEFQRNLSHEKRLYPSLPIYGASIEEIPPNPSQGNPPSSSSSSTSYYNLPSFKSLNTIFVNLTSTATSSSSSSSNPSTYPGKINLSPDEICFYSKEVIIQQLIHGNAKFSLRIFLHFLYLITEVRDFHQLIFYASSRSSSIIEESSLIFS